MSFKTEDKQKVKETMGKIKQEKEAEGESSVKKDMDKSSGKK